MNRQRTSSKTQSKPSIPKFPKKYWDNVWIFFIFAVAFWAIEFCFQYFWLSAGHLDQSLIRSCALTGATFFAFALLSSAIFKCFPRTAIHWQVRRHFAVSAFVFLVVHAAFVTWFYYKFNIAQEYATLNPFENPIVFGALALPILFIMAATSTEYAMNKLTPKVWKSLHHLIYVGFILSLLHMGLINPDLLNSPPGYLLVALLVATISSQIYCFFKTISKKTLHDR